MRSWLLFACISGLAVSCAPKQEAKVPASGRVTPPAPLVVAEEAPDLSPVARPREVVLVGRIARPRLLAETLAQWSSLPLKIEDVVPEQARALARAVLWEAPVELVVALDAFGEGKVPPPLLIGSVGLRSLDEALSAADAMHLPARKVAPGVFRVGDFPDTSCAVAVSLGAAPARLICGPKPKDVDALLPYATRGLAQEPRTGADFELALDAKPIQAQYAQDVAGLKLLGGLAIRELSFDLAGFDRALSDAVYGGIDETVSLFNDLDQVTFEARLDPSRSVLAGSAELRLGGNTSWTAGTIAALKTVPLPATLPRLPTGCSLASYSTALPAERYAALARVMGELAEGFLEHESLPGATRKRVRRILDGSFAKLPETFGFAVSPSPANAGGYRHAATTISRVSEPAARLLGVYTDFFGLFSDAALKRWVKQKSQIDGRLWPQVSRKPLKLVGFNVPATAFEITVDLKAWRAHDEKIATALRNALPPSDAKEVSRLELVIQPEGEHTYVLTGDDTAEMARVMAEHRKSEPGIGFARPARSERIIAAGFLTLAYAAHALERSTREPGLGRAVATAPHHGETPISFSSTAGPGRVRVDLELPAQAFTDASAIAIAIAPALKAAVGSQTQR